MNDLRFDFGKNWQQFLDSLNEERILNAVESVMEMLERDNLEGLRFLDIGSGSGLFSLAAKRLGAEVYSFDFDPYSVACTERLKSIYHPDNNSWKIEQGSALDEVYMRSLGKYDIVYAWGVLHHTGNMERALSNVQIPVSKNGLLYISIYNDQAIKSKFWKKVKKIYCSCWAGRYLVKSIFIPYFALQAVLISIIKYRNLNGCFSFYKKRRGMSIFRDWIDWLGGYPFEVAKPEKIFNFFKDNGFLLLNLTTTNGLGCNQFVFKKL